MTVRHVARLAVLLVLAASSAGAVQDLKPFDAKSLTSIRLEQAGKPFVLALWSVHCEPCIREMAIWRALRAKFPDTRVILVAVDPPAERAQVHRFLKRYDPGAVEHWSYVDDFEERTRFSIDPKWRGELPRTYFFDSDHRAESVSGVLDRKRAEQWFARVAR
jgi:thiol-disulfide isomerase/thioredoxin